MSLTSIYQSVSKLLFILFAFVSLLSCQPDDKFTGVAAGAAGRYIVTAYIDSSDTLFSLLPGPTGYKPGINKIGVSNFTIEMDITGPDQLLVRTDYWRKGLRTTFSKEVVVRLTNAYYQFSLLKTNSASSYEGRVGRMTGFFYEQTVGGGLLMPPADSLANSNPSATQAVVIVAQLTK